MKYFFILVSLLLMSFGLRSHGVDYSVVTLKEQASGHWSLQVTSSLDAFRKEVRMHFADSPYASPEEFSQQLLEHINETLVLKVNGKVLSLNEGKVILGHETSVLFKEVIIPSGSQVVTLTNGAVKDIYRHTSKLFVNEQEFDKKSFLLKKSNGFSVSFKVVAT